jgi:hypothetical protein
VTFLEVRQKIGLDSAIFAPVVLIYDVNGATPGGNGPIVVREILIRNARSDPADHPHAGGTPC